MNDDFALRYVRIYPVNSQAELVTLALRSWLGDYIHCIFIIYIPGARGIR